MAQPTRDPIKSDTTHKGPKQKWSNQNWCKLQEIQAKVVQPIRDPSPRERLCERPRIRPCEHPRKHPRYRPREQPRERRREHLRERRRENLYLKWKIKRKIAIFKCIRGLRPLRNFLRLFFLIHFSWDPKRKLFICIFCQISGDLFT